MNVIQAQAGPSRRRAKPFSNRLFAFARPTAARTAAKRRGPTRPASAAAAATARSSGASGAEKPPADTRRELSAAEIPQLSGSGGPHRRLGLREGAMPTAQCAGNTMHGGGGAGLQHA